MEGARRRAAATWGRQRARMMTRKEARDAWRSTRMLIETRISEVYPTGFFSAQINFNLPLLYETEALALRGVFLCAFSTVWFGAVWCLRPTTRTAHQRASPALSATSVPESAADATAVSIIFASSGKDRAKASSVTPCGLSFKSGHNVGQQAGANRQN